MAWSEICGQELVVAMLRADVAKQRVAPAYLFVEPGAPTRSATPNESVGVLAALELARALICAGGTDEACGSCDQCRRVQRGVHPDVHVLAPQGSARNIRIDEVRRVLERVSLRPFMARRQVVVLDGAEHLTDEAGNLLLKSLEEPPGAATFLLTSARPRACLPTVVSRCKVVRFGRASSERRDIPAAMLALYGSAQPRAWLEWPIPTDREEVSQWLSGSIAWLRDVAVVGSGGEALLADPQTAPVLRRQATVLDRERCIDAALRLVELSHSLEEQMVSARLIGTLLREEWLDLTCPTPTT